MAQPHVYSVLSMQRVSHDRGSSNAVAGPVPLETPILLIEMSKHGGAMSFLFYIGTKYSDT